MSVVDLLCLQDYEPPMGDLAVKPALSFTRSLWTIPIAGEEEAPAERIIHSRCLELQSPTTLHRVGLQYGKGYHKCGSRQDPDWITAFRVLVPDEASWKVIRSEQNLPEPADGTIDWYDLGNIRTSAAIIEVRKCGIDAWWPSWNLTSTGLVLEGTPPENLSPRDERTHVIRKISLSGISSGISVSHYDGQIRYSTPFLEVGFYLNRTGFSYLSIDPEGEGRTATNYLKIQPDMFFQGLQLHAIGDSPVAAPSLRYRINGSTTVEGNRIIYDLHNDREDFRYRLEWEVGERGLRLHADKSVSKAMRSWTSSLWSVALDSTAAPAHVLGPLTRKGETGLMRPPVLFHIPGAGSIRVNTRSNQILWRGDTYRPIDMTLQEMKLGEIPQSEGDYLHPADEYSAQIDLEVTQAKTPVKKGTPEIVRTTLQHTAHTSLTYRPETATLSNNGASMHALISMDSWAEVTTRLGRILPNLHPVDLLRNSLERWLGGGPGYASGPILQHGEIHDAEDEYLMTGTSCLLGLAIYLEHSGTSEWLERFHETLSNKLTKMHSRDLDNDGLIESELRTGTSGSGQWSTNWFDVISFGWKDAFANATLYRALRILARMLPELDAPELADGLDHWADELRSNYCDTFYNEETGWLAGWRCKEDRLHDYAFLAVNGAAVTHGLIEEQMAGEIIERLWHESQRQGMPDPKYGLPGNLWPIPDEDLADIMQGYPLGYYQNGGRTMAQARHFLGALFQVGMEAEGDYLLERIAHGLAEGVVFGGNKSGVDWRYWDDRPSGYEGLLTDQFGVLEVFLDRYGSSDQVHKR